MWDLAIAAAALTALSAAALLAGRYVAARWSRRATCGLSTVVLAALLVFVFRFHGTLHMARLVPFSGAVVLTNWIPLGGAFFAGVTLGQKNSPRWRRRFLASLVLLVSIYSVLGCFQGLLPLKPPAKQPIAVSPQSRPSSCGPCCAALLLQHHGIDATEREMLRLCLTSYRGCPALGLYRGLKLKTAQTDWDVQIVACTVDELMEMTGPLLLRIAIHPLVVMDGTHTTRERKTYQHAVLLMSVDDQGHVKIIDPAVPEDSRRDWRIERLHEQWLGEAIRLVPRDGTRPRS